MCAYIAGQSANFFLLSLSLPHFCPFYLSFLFPLPSLPSPFSSPSLLSLSHLSFCCSPVGCWLPPSYLLLFCCERVMDACCALKCVPRLNPQPATGGACFPFRLKTMMARFSKGVSEVTSYVNLMPTRSFQLSSIASGSWGHWIVYPMEAKSVKPHPHAHLVQVWRQRVCCTDPFQFL